MQVIKNTLLRKALEKNEKSFADLYDILNELSSELKLNFMHIEKGKINKINSENCCIISKEKIKNHTNQVGDDDENFIIYFNNCICG